MLGHTIISVLAVAAGLTAAAPALVPGALQLTKRAYVDRGPNSLAR